MKTILYVDDSEEDRELMNLAFRRSADNLRLEMVEGGEPGCAYLEGSSQFADRARFPFPDLVLLDLKMTDMSGFDVLYWIRSRAETAGLTVAIYSSSYVDSDIETACRLGADFFITKPSAWERQVVFVGLLQECFLSEPPNFAPLRKLSECKSCKSGESHLTHDP